MDNLVDKAEMLASVLSQEETDKVKYYSISPKKD